VSSDEPNKLDRAKAHWVGLAEAAHAKLAPAGAAIRSAATEAMLERFEADIAPLVAPIAQRLLDDPSTPDEVRDLLGVLTGPTHFGESVVIGIAIGSLLAPVLNAAIAPVVQTLANTAWQAAINSDASAGGVPLSPEIVATAWLKGVTLSNDPQTEAARSGIDADRLNDLQNIAGQAIGIEQAILLWRRGDITETELERVVHYSNVRSDFLPDIKALKFVPPAAGEVIAGRVKNHLDDATAQAYLSNAGIDPAVNYDWLVATAGRPLGLAQMLSLYNRGIATADDIAQTVAQSDVNPAFEKFALPLAVHFPAVFQILELVKSGAMTAARAAQILQFEGFEQEDIDSITSEFNASTSTGVKQLSATQVTRAYEQKLITAAEATTRLTELKYDAPTVTLILAVADNARADALLQATIKKVGTLYVSHKITKAAATTELGTATVPADAISTLFKFWDIERGANVRVPTEAAVVGAYRRNEISAAECKTRLTNMGVQQSDLAIFVADGWPPTKPATPEIISAVVNA